MMGMGGSKGAHIKSSFKIPSYALLKNDTTSPNYGYYTLNKDYELYADDINYAMESDKFYDWHFASYEDTLPADKFVRVHKSFIVSLHYIEDINKTTVTVAGNKIPIGESYRDDLIARLS